MADTQQCKKAIAMHWGTWKMAFDGIAEPPKLLEEARKVVGMKEEDFGIVALGETRGYEA
jgi:N-acyl-phosphatidylethanolamine-hydrolysing phospholipase D